MSDGPLPGPQRALLEWAYRCSLIGKGGLGLAQLIGGATLALSPQGALPRIVDWLTRNELLQDPTDTVALALRTWAAHLPVQSETVYALYLLGHGALNFGIVIALLIRLRGAYHLSMLVLIGFVLYQSAEFLRTHDPALLVLTAIDCVVIALVWFERRFSEQRAR